MRHDKSFRVEITADGTLKRHGNIATAHKHALMQARVDLQRAIDEIITSARSTGGAARALTTDERTKMDAMAAEGLEVSQAIVLAERELDVERAQATLGTNVRRTSGRTFAAMFPSVPRSSGGFRSPEEFLATIHSGLADQRLVPDYASRIGATATVGDSVRGGFSVPTEMFAQWLDASLENELVRPRADVRPMMSDSAVAAGFDDLDHSSELYGGFVGSWSPEATDMTPQTAQMRLIELKAKKLSLLARVSNELVADGVGFEQQLGEAIVKALGWFLDNAFLSGPGAGRPLGILNAGCTITVAKESGQPASSIKYENIVKMFARLAPGSFANAVWVANQTAIPQLLQTSVAVGVGGDFVPLLTRSASGGWEMLTRPVLFTEKLPALGTKGDIMLCDFSQYVVGLRADFTLAKSQHAGFASDTSYYRGIIRVDGMPKLPSAITPANGDTVSPFVVLAARG